MIEKIKNWALAAFAFIAGIAILMLQRSQQANKTLSNKVKSSTLDKEIAHDLEKGAQALDEYTGSRQSYDEWKAAHGRGSKSG